MPELNKIRFAASRSYQPNVTFEYFIWDFACNLRPPVPQQQANIANFDNYGRGRAVTDLLWQKIAICNIFIFRTFLADSGRPTLSARTKAKNISQK